MPTTCTCPEEFLLFSLGHVPEKRVPRALGLPTCLLPAPSARLRERDELGRRDGKRILQRLETIPVHSEAVCGGTEQQTERGERGGGWGAFNAPSVCDRRKREGRIVC
ncbi:hypothetical protein WMY93_023427 [Mugilogobius chulae]|uniref:Uncharacterized protein n=1 Tax=Mugilogobius chulae TaxID=88201 RepID=A0AAW0N480_9GOBI